MKIPEHLPVRNLISKDRRGVALITVLTVMALTTILVLTFFSLATSEHRASNTYSQGIQAQQVAEGAVNMVISQIREATTTERPGDSLQNRIAWACQPGAIRRWTNNGTIDSLYKLYSDDTMKTDQANEFSKDYGDLNGWSEKHSHFVDLNEPVIRGQKVGALALPVG
jgi:Tfp pilus assembly protein PilX